MTYKEKLKHPYWQKKRLEIFQRDNWECSLCMNPQVTLVVHHKKYLSGKNPWEYDNKYLITLCENCHNIFHEKNNKKEVITKPASLPSMPGTTSIKGMQKNKTKNGFTKGHLLIAWNEIIETFKIDKNFYITLKNSIISKGTLENELYIKVGNGLLRQELVDRKMDILPLLRNKLNDNQIELYIELI